MAVLSDSHSQTAKTPAQCKQSRGDGLAKGSGNLIDVWGYVFPGKSIHGTNFTSSLNIKTLKNVSLRMFVRVFPTNVSHKENVEYGPQELFRISSPLLPCVPRIYLQPASSESTNTSLFPDFLLSGEV